MNPTDEVINCLNNIGLSEVIPAIRYDSFFEVWFFYCRGMQFGIDRHGVITLFGFEGTDLD
jgi:hypothetical protein